MPARNPNQSHSRWRGRGYWPSAPSPFPTSFPAVTWRGAHGWGRGPGSRRRGPGGEEGTQRVGGSAGCCGVTMTTGPKAAREVTRTRLAQGHVSSGGGGGAAPEPRPWRGLAHVLVAGMAAGIVGLDRGPPSHLCSPPVHTSLDPACRSSAGAGLLSDCCWRADLGWHWWCSATEKAGNRENKQKERQTQLEGETELRDTDRNSVEQGRVKPEKEGLKN